MFATTASEAYSHRGVDNNGLAAVQFVSARVASFGFTTTTTKKKKKKKKKTKKNRESIEGFWKLKALYSLKTGNA